MSTDGPILEITKDEAETLSVALGQTYFSLKQQAAGEDSVEYFKAVSDIKLRVDDFIKRTNRKPRGRKVLA